MTRTSIVLLALALLGCSGGGVSTTARGSFGDTDDTMPSSTTTPASTTDPGTSSEPATTTDPSTTGVDPTTGTLESEGSGELATDTGEPVTLEGAWVSEGENVAPILVQSAAVVRIDAVFADGTFTVTSLDSEGNEVVQAGVYSATPSGVGEIFDIVLEQSSPQAITVEGIYEIDDGTDPPTMTYEVVQTMPSVGAVAPTAEGGFGSTALGADLTQRYVRL